MRRRLHHTVYIAVVVDLRVAYVAVVVDLVVLNGPSS